MAVVQNTYTGNGSTVLYSLSFPYLDQTDVKVSVNGSVVTNYIFATASSIQFLTAPSAGAAIIIYRETSNDETSATIFPGSAIKAADLNNNFTQILYAVQEVVARYISSIGGTLSGILNMGGNKITNLGAPTSGTDAATKTYVDSVALAAIPDGDKGDITTSSLGTVWTIDNDVIEDNNVSPTAAISGAKITPHFGNQHITTDSYIASKNQGKLRLYESTSNGNHYVALKSPANLTANHVWTLPDVDGTSGQALTTNGSGTLSWSSAAAAKISVGNTEAEVVDTGVDGHFKVTTEGTEALRVDASQRLLVGTSTAQGNSTVTIEQTAADSAPLALRYTSTNDSRIGIDFYRSRSSSAKVESTDPIMRLDAYGYDGSAYRRGASIEAIVDAATSAGDMPCRLVFSTTADGSASPTERMRISNAGNFGFNTTTLTGKYNFDGSIYLFTQPSGAGTNALKFNTSTGAVTYDASSRLIKENIEPCPYGIAEIKQLQPRKYFRTDDQKDEIGFIADEVVEILPEFVPLAKKSTLTHNEEDTEIIPIAVNYEKLTAVLTKALQEAIERIETLEAKVAALEAA